MGAVGRGGGGGGAPACMAAAVACAVASAVAAIDAALLADGGGGGGPGRMSEDGGGSIPVGGGTCPCCITAAIRARSASSCLNSSFFWSINCCGIPLGVDWALASIFHSSPMNIRAFLAYYLREMKLKTVYKSCIAGQQCNYSKHENSCEQIMLKRLDTITAHGINVLEETQSSSFACAWAPVAWVLPKC